jgi:Leucine-rich repeat (LRR) protein
LPNKSKKLQQCVTLWLVLIISLVVPLQAVSATAMAASSATTASSATSDESIDDWMPDKNLQKLVYTALHSWDYSNDDHGGHETTAVSQVTPAMMADILYLNIINSDGTHASDHVTGITDLTGLQYATGLQQVNFTGSTIKKAPGDWSVLNGISVQSTLDGKDDGANDGLVVDASSAGADLKDLAKSTVSYKLTNDNDIGMPNHADNPDAPKAGIAVTTLTPGQNISYNLADKTAYIPLSNWYKGFVSTDEGTADAPKYVYGDSVTTGATMPKGVTWDATNHRFVVDLSVCGGKELKLPSFDIKDGTYYNAGNTLDATVPMTSASQTITVNRATPTGTIDASTLGFSQTDSPSFAVSGGLDNQDITFTSNLAANQINFTLTASGLQKLENGDLTADVMMLADNKLVDLTLNLQEPETSWLPDKNLQAALQAALGTQKLTKANLANIKKLDVSNVSNLSGLAYATNLTELKLTDCDLAADGDVDLKPTNSAVLGQLTSLQSLEIDSSDLGGSLAGWGLNKLTNLTSLIANSDALSEAGVTDYADDKLTVLNLSDNDLKGALSQFSAAAWSGLTQLQLRSNKLTGTIPADWADLKNLSILDLNSNQLSGTLGNISQLTNLTQVYLSNNGFTGELPAAWFDSSLTYLEAERNQLSGSLPELRAATNLASLDVSYNALTGDLPDLSKTVKLTKMAYGANQITSGTTISGASGNYQTWSIADPDWQTSRDGRTMTLDLSQYYHGEPGQDYRYLGIDMNGGTQTGITLNKTDPDHPLLTIDTANTNLTNGDFTFNLFDQVGKQATNGEMNYLATVTVPVTLALPKSYAIDTGSDTGSEATIDFGSPKVGAGMVPANNFKLGVSSTNAAGDSYQLTAQTDGLTANGRTLPLYYGNGQHQTLLTTAAQAIYDYQPTTNDGSETIVGNSQDDTKGNLHTDVPVTTYTGTYTGTVTYTLASAPAEDTATAAQDADLTKISSLSGLSPTLSGLDATAESTRAGLEKNMTSFVKSGLADADGVLYSSYKAGQTGGSYEQLSETTSLWLLALANQGDVTDFDTAFSGMVKRFYDSDKGIFNWRAEGADHTLTQGSASIDDLRIIQALLIMNQKDPGNNDRVTWIKNLMNGFAKYDLNAYYQMINGYNSNGQEKRIRLDYLDLATLKAVYEAKGLYASGNTAGETAYQQQLKLIKDSYISDQFPFFATYYDYSTGNYQVAADASEDPSISEGHINITDALLTMLNLAKVHELPAASLNWLKANTADRHIYNNYKLDGTPVDTNDAPSNYGYVAQIAAAVGDTDLYQQVLTVMNTMTSTDTTSPLYGSTAYAGESYAFNDLNMLLGYTSVLSANS